MGLHVREMRKLRQIEESLRREDPRLDALLAGRSPPGQPAQPGQPRPPRQSVFRAPSAGVLAAWLLAGCLAGYLVPPALLAAGLVMDATWLVVAGAISCPLVPVITWLLIRRHFIRRGPSHCRES